MDFYGGSGTVKKYVILIFIIFSCLLILVNNYYSADLHSVNIVIVEKEKLNSKYIIYATTLDDRDISFHLSPEDKVIIKVNNSATDYTASEVWEQIKTGNEYKVLFKDLMFPYTLLNHEQKLIELHL